MSTLFWPLDVDQRRAGFSYGWTKPCLCVIGVINTSTSREAEKALEHLKTLQEYRTLVEACRGYHPTVFGHLKDDNTVYYHRHSPTSLRFYSDGARKDEHNRSFQPHARYWDRLPVDDSGIIEQFNAAKAIDILLQAHIRPPSHRIKTDVLWHAFDASWAYISPPLKLCASVLDSICGYPMFLHLALKDVSATFQQLDVRAEQAEFFASEVQPLRQRGLASTAAFSTRYTNFFNIIWLILNDVTIGSALGTFLCENHVFLASTLNSTLKHVLIDWVQWMLQWLDSWPAGLKLNTELSQFYSHTLIHMVAIWGSALQGCEPYVPMALYTIGIASSGGATIAISLCSDLFGLSTIHIYVCYLISNFVYARFLRTFGSLWNLFRGKRHNVLRNRTDTWEYDIDQLLFGTILFTLVAFLFPTVLAYYSLFALMRFVIILIQACLETQLAFMNHFPLFALMLRVKDPWRLPGGIFFAIERGSGGLTVESQPTPFTDIFFQYIRLLSRLAKHYNPLRLVWQLLSGEVVQPIPRYEIRYATGRQS